LSCEIHHFKIRYKVIISLIQNPVLLLSVEDKVSKIWNNRFQLKTQTLKNVTITIEGAFLDSAFNDRTVYLHRGLILADETLTQDYTI
jgi:hypothetical protein